MMRMNWITYIKSPIKISDQIDPSLQVILDYSMAFVFFLLFLSLFAGDFVLHVDANCEVQVYYKGIHGLLEGRVPTNQEEWSSMITALYELLRSTHVVVPYTSTSGGVDVWSALRVLDADSKNPNNVRVVYSNISIAFAGYGGTNTWNREHIWPRSYGLFDNGPDHSDLHNLRPVLSRVNSARNNLYYDDCYPSIDSSCVQPAHADAASDTAKNSRKFMPTAAEKGDLARHAFYTALRYNGTRGTTPESNTEQLVLSTCACVSSRSFGNLTTLLKWHAADPVSAEERLRNNLTCSNYQVNHHMHFILGITY